MAQHIEWLIQQRVLYCTLEGIVDHATFIKFNAEVASHIEDGIEPVHLVSDLRDVKFHTVSIRSISNTTAIRNPKVGYVIVLGANQFIKFTIDAVRIITNTKISMVNTMEDALDLLWDLDASLPRTL